MANNPEILIEVSDIGTERTRRNVRKLSGEARSIVEVNEDIARSADRIDARVSRAFLRYSNQVNNARSAARQFNEAARKQGLAFTEVSNASNKLERNLKRTTDALRNEAAAAAATNDAKEKNRRTSLALAKADRIANNEKQKFNSILQSTRTQLNRNAEANRENERRLRRFGTTTRLASRQIQELGQSLKAVNPQQALLKRNLRDVASQQRQVRRSTKSVAQAINENSQNSKDAARSNSLFARSVNRLATTVRGIEGPLGGAAARLQTLSAVVKRGDLALTSFTAIIVGAGVAVGSFTAAATAVRLQLEQINNTLLSASGSAETASQTFEFLKAVSRDLGTELTQSARQFANLQAAARGTSIQGQETREIFKGVATAATALGLTAQETGGALRAIQQIISKGTVQAEELRGQLGERIPGAFQIAARATNNTTEELNKLLEQGEVISDEFLPKFARELQKTFSEGAQEGAKSLRSEFNRLRNEIVLFISNLDKIVGASEFVRETVASLADVLERANKALTGAREETASYERILEDFRKSQDAATASTKNQVQQQIQSSRLADEARARIERLSDSLIEFAKWQRGFFGNQLLGKQFLGPIREDLKAISETIVTLREAQLNFSFTEEGRIAAQNEVLKELRTNFKELLTAADIQQGETQAEFQLRVLQQAIQESGRAITETDKRLSELEKQSVETRKELRATLSVPAGEREGTAALAGAIGFIGPAFEEAAKKARGFTDAVKTAARESERVRLLFGQEQIEPGTSRAGFPVDPDKTEESSDALKGLSSAFRDAADRAKEFSEARDAAFQETTRAERFFATLSDLVRESNQEIKELQERLGSDAFEAGTGNTVNRLQQRLAELEEERSSSVAKQEDRKDGIVRSAQEELRVERQLVGATDEQRQITEAVVDARRRIKDLREDGVAISEREKRNILETVRRIEQQRIAIEKVNEVVEGITEGISSSIESVLRDQEINFKNFLERIENFFITTFADIAAQVARQRIVVPVVTSIAGAAGIPGFGGGAGGGNGLLNTANQASQAVGLGRQLFGGGGSGIPFASTINNRIGTALGFAPGAGTTGAVEAGTGAVAQGSNFGNLTLTGGLQAGGAGFAADFAASKLIGAFGGGELSQGVGGTLAATGAGFAVGGPPGAAIAGIASAISNVLGATDFFGLLGKDDKEFSIETRRPGATGSDISDGSVLARSPIGAIGIPESGISGDEFEKAFAKRVAELDKQFVRFLTDAQVEAARDALIGRGVEVDVGKELDKDEIGQALADRVQTIAQTVGVEIPEKIRKAARSESASPEELQKPIQQLIQNIEFANKLPQRLEALREGTTFEDSLQQQALNNINNLVNTVTSIRQKVKDTFSGARQEQELANTNEAVAAFLRRQLGITEGLSQEQLTGTEQSVRRLEIRIEELKNPSSELSSLLEDLGISIQNAIDATKESISDLQEDRAIELRAGLLPEGQRRAGQQIIDFATGQLDALRSEYFNNPNIDIELFRDTINQNFEEALSGLELSALKNLRDFFFEFRDSIDNSQVILDNITEVIQNFNKDAEEASKNLERIFQSFSQFQLSNFEQLGIQRTPSLVTRAAGLGGTEIGGALNELLRGGTSVEAIREFAGQVPELAANSDQAQAAFGILNDELARLADNGQDAGSNIRQLNEARESAALGAAERILGQTETGRIRLERMGLGGLTEQLNAITGAEEIDSAASALTEFVNKANQSATGADQLNSAAQIALSAFDRVRQDLRESGETALSVSEAESNLINARSELVRQLEQERSALQSTKQELTGFIDQIEQTQRQIRLGDDSPLSPQRRFQEQQERFLSLANQFRTGDEEARQEAINQLPGAAQAFNQARISFLGGGTQRSIRVFERIQNILDNSKETAEDQLSDTERQIKQLDRQIGKQNDMIAELRRGNKEIEGVTGTIDSVREANNFVEGAVHDLETAIDNRDTAKDIGDAVGESVRDALRDLIDNLPDTGGGGGGGDDTGGDTGGGGSGGGNDLLPTKGGSRVFLDRNEEIRARSGQEIFGRSGGNELVSLRGGARNTQIDANVERIRLDGSPSGFSGRVTNQGFQILQGGDVRATLPSVNQPTTLEFSGGRTRTLEQVGAQEFTVGGKTIRAKPNLRNLSDSAALELFKNLGIAKHRFGNTFAIDTGNFLPFPLIGPDQKFSDFTSRFKDAAQERVNDLIPETVGFQSGGSFRVPNAQGPDNVVPLFRASPGENVQVSQPGQMEALINEVRALRQAIESGQIRKEQLDEQQLELLEQQTDNMERQNRRDRFERKAG